MGTVSAQDFARTYLAHHELESVIIIIVIIIIIIIIIIIVIIQTVSAQPHPVGSSTSKKQGEKGEGRWAGEQMSV